VQCNAVQLPQETKKPLPLPGCVKVAFESKPGIDFRNITPEINAEIEKTGEACALLVLGFHSGAHATYGLQAIRPCLCAGLQEGIVTVISRHTTTAIAINEDEPRLRDDIRQVWAAFLFLQLSLAA